MVRAMKHVFFASSVVSTFVLQVHQCYAARSAPGEAQLSSERRNIVLPKDQQYVQLQPIIVHEGSGTTSFDANQDSDGDGETTPPSRASVRVSSSSTRGISLQPNKKCSLLGAAVLAAVYCSAGGGKPVLFGAPTSSTSSLHQGEHSDAMSTHEAPDSSAFHPVDVEQKFLNGDFTAKGNVIAKEKIGQQNTGNGDYQQDGNTMAKTRIGQQNNIEKKFLEASDTGLNAVQQKFLNGHFHAGGQVVRKVTIGQQNDIANGAHVGSIEYHDGRTGATATAVSPGAVNLPPLAGGGVLPSTNPSANNLPAHDAVVGQQNNFGPGTHVGTFQLPMPNTQKINQGEAQAAAAGVPYVAQQNTFNGGHYGTISGSPQGGTVVTSGGQPQTPMAPQPPVVAPAPVPPNAWHKILQFLHLESPPTQ